MIPVIAVDGFYSHLHLSNYLTELTPFFQSVAIVRLTKLIMLAF